MASRDGEKGSQGIRGCSYCFVTISAMFLRSQEPQMTFKISMNSPCTNLFLRINWYFLGGNIFTQIFKISTELYPNNINYYKTTLL